MGIIESKRRGWFKYFGYGGRAQKVCTKKVTTGHVTLYSPLLISGTELAETQLQVACGITTRDCIVFAPTAWAPDKSHLDKERAQI